MNRSPHIRLATPADIPDVLSLLRELSVYLGTPDAVKSNPEAFEHYGFGDDSLFHIMIAHLNMKPVGFTLFYPEFSTWRGSPGTYVLDLYITEDCRGTGLGKSLLDETRTFAKSSWDSAYLRLAVHDHNESAIGFYERNGFIRSDEEILMISPDEHID